MFALNEIIPFLRIQTCTLQEALDDVRNVLGGLGLVFYGFPLHPAGKLGTERAEHLFKVSVPMLFLQGTNDALADLDLAAVIPASPKELVEIFRAVQE